jgi:hypothetical protein
LEPALDLGDVLARAHVRATEREHRQVGGRHPASIALRCSSGARR